MRNLYCILLVMGLLSSCEKDSVLSDSKVDTRIKNEQGIAEQQFRAILEEYDLNMSFIFFSKYPYKPLTKEEKEHYRAFFRKLSSLQTRAYRWQDDFRISEEGGYWIGSRNAVPHPVPFYCAVYWNSYNWNPYYYSGSYAVNSAGQNYTSTGYQEVTGAPSQFTWKERGYLITGSAFTEWVEINGHIWCAGDPCFADCDIFVGNIPD